MNLGLADAHNLAWKLARCVTGAADDELVHTYEQERRPIGAATVAESPRRLAAARADHLTGASRLVSGVECCNTVSHSQARQRIPQPAAVLFEYLEEVQVGSWKVDQLDGAGAGDVRVAG